MFPNLLVLLSAGAFPTAIPPSPPPEDELARLVARLDDDDFRVRDQAARRLREAGLGAVPRLRKAADESPSAEVRTRLADVIAAINRLPWWDDAAAARAEARRTGKPILFVSTLGGPAGFG